MLKKWIVLTLVLMLSVFPAALAEGLEIEEEPVIEETEDIVLSEDVDNIAEEEDFMLFSDEPIEKGYADFLAEENPADIPINASHFPDENFRTYVQENIDTDGNGALSEGESAAVTDVNVDSMGIASLQGIECFPNLATLSCSYNELSSLDVSKNTALTMLECTENQLTRLDVSQCPELAFLNCIGNQLTSLDVSKNTKLLNLDCGSNQLTSLDLSHCPELGCLFCEYNQLTDLNLGQNTVMYELWCQYNQLTSLDVSGIPALERFYCQNNRLTDLDLSKNSKLYMLSCVGNEIDALDLSNCDSDLKQALLNGPGFSVDEEDSHVLYIMEVETYELFINDSTSVIVDGRIIYLGVGQKVGVSFCDITVKNKTYTGKAIKPAPVVKYNGATLTKGTDYTVSYKNNTKVGTATVTVKGKGNYTGSRKVTFKINPKGTTISKVTPGKKKLTVTWKKQTKQVSGYQIQYGTKKDFSNAKKLTVKGTKTAKATIKSLKAKKTYYVRIRTYKTVSGKKYYSSWSKYKKVKTK